MNLDTNVQRLLQKQQRQCEYKGIDYKMAVHVRKQKEKGIDLMKAYVLSPKCFNFAVSMVRSDIQNVVSNLKQALKLKTREFRNEDRHNYIGGSTTERHRALW